MKVTPMPPRKKPLRRTPLHARRVAGRSARQRSAERELARTKRLVWLRCGGRCEMCGKPLREGEWEASHRRHDGMGGQGAANQRPSNILASCAGPRGCNQRFEYDGRWRAAGVAMGWLISRATNPARQPVNVFIQNGHCRVLLTDDGNYVEAS